MDAFPLGLSLGIVGPTPPQVLEQLPSMPASPLVKGERLHPTDSWSDFSEDLSTMVIVHRFSEGIENRGKKIKVGINLWKSYAIVCVQTIQI